MTSLHCQRALLPEGWRKRVRIELCGGTIASSQADCDPLADDLRCGFALPGMPNLHSHGFQRGMAGLSERRQRPDASLPDDSFWSWRELMYRFLGRMTPDDVEAITALAYIEMLEGGFTRVGEFHYLHNDVDGRPYADPAELAARIAAASARAGIRLSLLPCFYAHGDFGAAPPSRGQARFVSGLDGYATLLQACEALVGRLDGATLGVAPHSLRAVVPEQLRHLVGLAAGRPIHIHVAEQQREVEACLAWSGMRPVQWLLRHAPVDPRWCLIHATHLTQEETRDLARSGAGIGLCPITEASLGDGIPDAEAWTAAGGRAIGIGTDSNILIGVAEELRQLEMAQRLALRRRCIMARPSQPSTGTALYGDALAGGAAMLGAPAPRLAAGEPADIVTLAAQAPCFAAADAGTLLDCWIFAGDRAVVSDVWCAGAHLVQSGRHVRREAVEAAYRSSLRRLVART